MDIVSARKAVRSLTRATMTAVVACIAGQAEGADLARVVKAPVAVAAFDWSGFYLGAQAGYGWGNASDGDTPDFDLTPAGGFVGGLAGYNFRFADRAVAGVEVDAASADMHDGMTVVHPNAFNGTNTNIGSLRVNAFGTVRGRVGYAFDNVLPYLTGGFAWARTALTYTQPVTLNGSYFPDASDADASKFRFGGAIGAGVEYAVARHWSAKTEYLYLDFGRAGYPAIGFPAFGGIPFDIHPRLTLHTVKAALAYRF